MSNLRVVRAESEQRPFTPSPQQEAIFEFVRAGTGHGVVVARAGTGKTATIIHALDELSPALRVLCCAFNRRIRDELAKRVPDGVQVMTLHQLGRATLARERNFRSFQHDDDKDLRIARIAISNTRFTDTDEGRREMDDVVDRVRAGAALVKATLTATRPELIQLLQDFELDGSHIPAEDLAPLVARAVREALTGWPATSFDDEIWLPVHYNLGLGYYDVVFVDECQDLTLSQLRLAQSALHHDGRIIAVGDPAQCQPTGTLVKKIIRKADRWNAEQLVDVPIERIRVGDIVLGYTLADATFKKAQRVREISARRFKGELIEVETVEVARRSSRYTPEHWCIASFRAIKSKYCVYLMQRGRHWRIGMTRLQHTDGVSGPDSRMRAEAADAVWILEVHDDRKRALLREAWIAARFGIPTMMFTVKHGSAFTQKELDTFWDSIVVEEAAEAVLRWFGRDIRFPICARGQARGFYVSRPFEIRASNLLDGCLMLPYRGRTTHVGRKDWVPIIVRRVPWTGKVHSLDVEGGLYVADDLVTHNSIYKWRGADEDTVARIGNELKAKTFPLSVSFRCPKAVVARAQRYVPDFEAAPDAPEGVVKQIELADMLTAVRPGDFILSRTNAPLAQICLDLVQNKVPARIVGQDVGRRLIALVKRSKARTVADLLVWLATWEEKEVARLEGQKREAAARVVTDMVETLRQFADGELTIPAVMKAIDDLFVEDRKAYVICSTVHRLKGDEANRVFMLEETFFIPRGDANEEANIHYVAMTRSRRELFSVYGLYKKQQDDDT